ncbi:hypothetical protein L4D09_13855 [Photobacterium makurazakiensis]|uniref:hypothetical protein n=1 Tax=Photobacterium makurazakiensis TaxID=2910234 RepID=UPI003D11BBB2
MQANIIVMIITLGILAVDKLSWFDDGIEEYVNAPRNEPSITLSESPSPNGKGGEAENVMTANQQKLAKYYEQSMQPEIKSVVLGNLIVPANY